VDYKYIEQLLERYWNAETTLEEESILRTFFSQKDIPDEMQHLRPLFSDEASSQTLDDDFDARVLEMINAPVVTAKEVTITERLMPLFKAAAVVAIILTLGGALQAPWDTTWNDPLDYASTLPQVDSVTAVSPVQAENMADVTVDSTNVRVASQPTD